MKLLAIDTETTGLDIRHGCRPFFVTICFDNWSQAHWEWDVDPLTRRVLADRNDLLEIAGLLGEAEEVVGQNIKFDVGALTYLFRDHSIDFRWPWDRTHDTLIAGHTLHSSEPHDLTSMLLLYTRKADIKLLEDALEQRTQECRRIVQQAVLRVKRHALKVARAGQPAAAAAVREPPPGRPRPKPKGPQLRSWRPPTKAELKAEEELRLAQVFRGWKITTEDDPLLPSAGGKGMWRGDGWLPRAVALYRWSVLKDPAYDPSLPVDRRHPYWDVLAHYGNADSAATLVIWLHQVRELKGKHIWPHYLVRRHSSSLAYRMEDHGVSCSLDRQATIKAEYEQASLEAGEECVAIARARGYDLTLPKSGVNDSLSEFCYGRILNVNGVKDPGLRMVIPEALMLPVKARSEKTGAPSLDKDVLAAYEVELEPDTDALRFVKALRAKRKRDKALENLATYERFWLPWVPAYPGSTDPQTGAGWYVLHPQLNPTGTSTLRWSSNNPNEQNISKQEGFNLRYVFGPLPGREWWAFDAKNIELRIPAYEAGEAEKIALFERPDDPPYYGSDHILNFSIVYPDVWARAVKEVGLDKAGPYCKKTYASTYYQWVKNGDFAVQYGAIDKADGTGTADRAFHKPGGHALLNSKFVKLKGLNQKWINFANKHGYVETLPDRTVDPRRGCPIECSRTDWGKILPTVPLNYHVQSTACWWMLRAMIKVQQQLDEWRTGPNPFDAHLVLQVHDELVVDMPKSAVHPKHDFDPDRKDKIKLVRRSNLWRARIIQRLMASVGEDLIPRVPTPVGVEYHEVSYDEGVSL